MSFWKNDGWKPPCSDLASRPSKHHEIHACFHLLQRSRCQGQTQKGTLISVCSSVSWVQNQTLHRWGWIQQDLEKKEGHLSLFPQPARESTPTRQSPGTTYWSFCLSYKPGLENSPNTDCLSIFISLSCSVCQIHWAHTCYGSNFYLSHSCL